MRNAKDYCSYVGNAYFMAMDSLGSNTDIVITCDLKRAVPIETAVKAFQELLASHEALQRLRSRAPAAASWEWLAAPEQAWRQDWELIRSELLETGIAPAALHPACKLPFRLFECSELKLVFRVEHTFANGRGSYAWLERYFSLLSASQGLAAPGPAAAGQAEIADGAPLRLALLHTVASLFRRKRILRGNGDMRLPLLRQSRSPLFSFHAERFVLSDREVSAAFLRHRAAGESYTQTLTRRLSEQVLADYPALHGVGVQVAADLHRHCGIDLYEVGNFTGLITGYIERRLPVQEQTAALFKRIRGGAAPGFSKLFAQVMPNRLKLVHWFRGQCRSALEDAGELMMDPLFTVSNMGNIDGPHTCLWLAATSLHTSMPSVYVSATRIGEWTAFEIVFPDNIFDQQKISALMLRFFGFEQGCPPDHAERGVLAGTA